MFANLETGVTKMNKKIELLDIDRLEREKKGASATRCRLYEHKQTYCRQDENIGVTPGKKVAL